MAGKVTAAEYAKVKEATAKYTDESKAAFTEAYNKSRASGMTASEAGKANI